MFAGRLLELCWKFAGSCYKHPIRPVLDLPTRVTQTTGCLGAEPSWRGTILVKIGKPIINLRK